MPVAVGGTEEPAQTGPDNNIADHGSGANRGLWKQGQIAVCGPSWPFPPRELPAQ